MKTDRDMTRIVRSWLEVGADRLPDRLLDSVLDQLPAHKQRRPPIWRPRRFAHMNTLAKTAIAAAAVLVVAVLGYNLLPGNGPGGQPTPTPIVTPTPSPTAPPEITKGDLAAGTYSYSAPDLTQTPFTLTVPAGWRLDADSFIIKGIDWKTNAVLLATWRVSHVYVESCQGPRTLTAVGSKAALVAALAAQTGHETSGPTEVTLGGLPATRFEFSFATDFDMTACDNGIVRLWPDPGPDESGGLPMWAGQTTTVYVVDDNGKVTALVTVRNANAPAGDVAELQAILDSVHFVR